MANERRGPIIAPVISIIAGIEIIFIGFLFAFGGGILSKGVGPIIGITGMTWGALVIVSASLMHWRSKRHVLWGALVVVFSIGSFYGALGGIFFGLIIGVIGGILGMIWSPRKDNSEVMGSVEAPAK